MATRNGKEEKKEEINTNEQNTSAQSSPATLDVPEALKAALRISSTVPLGSPLRNMRAIDEYSSNLGGDDEYYDGSDRTNPGVCVLYYIPTMGISNGSATTALNRATSYDFNLLRSEISGSREYQKSDSYIYRMAAESCELLYYEIKRNYKLLKTFAATNRYRPNMLFEALGLDYEDWIKNSANVYQWLINNAHIMCSFPRIPVGTITERHKAWLEAIFTDGEPECSQSYVMQPAVYWSYEVVDKVKGLTPRRPENGTFESYVKLFGELLNALAHSKDVDIICADIRRGYKEKMITDLNPPAMDEMLSYVKLDSALTTFMNVNTVLTHDLDDPATLETAINTVAYALRVYDVDGQLAAGKPVLESYSITENADGEFEGRIMIPGRRDYVNMVEQAPSESAFACALQLNPDVSVRIFRDEEEGTWDITSEFHNIGTEVVTHYVLCTLCDGTLEKRVCGTYHLVGDNVLEDDFELGLIRNNFDWAPAHTSISYFDNSVNAMHQHRSMEDFQNYIPISRTNKEQFFDTMLLHEFGVL